ncbi:MAG: tetratricopeptide repeat protein [Blastocatellia bacterium]|nr:tetratricopeptide repeat protein [Blastocatellia bacterium]
MKKTLLSGFIIGLFCIAASAQKIAKPTLTPKPVTEAQMLLIRQGVAFHDSKKFDEAIAKYEQVLAENPDSTQALHELSMSLYTKGDRVKAMETAYRGSKYKSEELPLFYQTMASSIDDVGKPDEAVKIYRDAIRLLKDDKEFLPYLSSLHYNLGVTFVRQNKHNEARSELKRAVEYNFKYASPHFLLAIVYNGTKYKVPAMLAAARLISLEINSQRTKQSAAILLNGLKPAEKNAKTGNTTIFLDFDAPKDEGDFGMYDLFLGTLTTIRKDEDKNKSDNEIFAEAIDTFIALLSGDNKLKSTFTGKNYVPFLTDMKRQGHTKAFAFLVLYQNGNTEALKWLTENKPKLVALVNWAKTYELPK